mgnify:CR=1 FL=1
MLLHAERNLDTEVEADETHTTGGPRTTVITGHESSTFKAGEERNITLGAVETIDGNETRTVTGHASETVHGGETRTIEQGAVEHISGGETRTVHSGSSEDVTGEVAVTINGAVLRVVTGSDIRITCSGRVEIVCSGSSRAAGTSQLTSNSMPSGSCAYSAFVEPWSDAPTSAPRSVSTPEIRCSSARVSTSHARW